MIVDEDHEYIVAWTGGYEMPSFCAFRDRGDAVACARDWYSQSESNVGDIVQILTLSVSAATILKVEYAPDWDSNVWITEKIPG